VRRGIPWAVLVLAACARGERDAAPQPPPDPPPPVAWSFDPPTAWDDRVQLDGDSTMPGTYRSARLFSYTPRDTTIVPQALLGIIVYDSAAWAAVRKEEGPPQGDSLASFQGQVFIASLPQSNPFAEGSADARTFDSLAVGLEEVKRRFRVVR
jgi:hypothetical protein